MKINNWIISQDFSNVDKFSFSYTEIKQKFDYVENLGNDNRVILCDDTFVLYFLEEEFELLTISDLYKLYFKIGRKKFKLHDIGLSRLIKLLNKLDISWRFYQDYCFLNQVAIVTSSNWVFVLSFNRSSDGVIRKLYYPHDFV